MTATAQPPAPSNDSPHPVLARAQGVELLGNVDGSGYRSGSALVRRGDGQMVQLGPLMYALLEAIDGRSDTEQLAGELCRRLGRPCDEEHVVKLAEKLARQGLLAGSEQNAPPRRNPLLALRFKVLITSPKVTRRITAPFTFLFHPVVVWPAVAAFVAVLWYVLFRKGLGSATADAFDRPGLLLLVFALAVASAAFHEIGHAAACRYGGATPGGMGAGLYMVWPAFYTDVTDAYRLPRRDRLRVDLGGIYFNALVAVVTLGVWLALHVDALLLLVGLQVLMIVKNLSPVIRSDGYHILADATGVPDLYAHLLPTLRRLIPGRPKEPSALRGRARALVTGWVLVVVPVLLALMAGAVVLLPRMLATAWTSGHRIASAMPHEGAVGIGASLLKLLALVLPVAGSILIAQRLARAGVAGARTWAGGRPVRQGALVLAASAAAAGAAFAWWPSGQYQAIRPTDHGTLVGFASAVSRPVAAVRPMRPAAAPVHLAPGTHLALSLIPVGGATRTRPALFVIPGQAGRPAVALVSTSTPDPAGAPSTESTATSGQAATATTTTTTTTTIAPTQTDSAPTTTAAAFPFTLPSKPRPGDSQALAVNTKDGSVKYDIAYSLVTVSGGAPVTNANTAYAFASCRACTTVAVSFQVVLIVGSSRTIAPINIAGALNKNCPACLTTAIADQIVVTLRSTPTPQLVNQIEAALKELGAIKALGTNATPAAIAAQVGAVQQQIDTALQQSGQLANPATTSTVATTTQATTTTAATTTTPAATTTAATTTTTAATTPTTTTAATTTTSATTTATTTPTTTEETTTTTAETTTSTTEPTTTTAP